MSTFTPKPAPVPPAERITNASLGLRREMRSGDLAPRDVPDAIAAAGKVGRDTLAKATSNASAARERATEARGPVDPGRVAYERQRLEARLAVNAGDGPTHAANRAAIIELAFDEAERRGDQDALDAIAFVAAHAAPTLGDDGTDIRRRAAATLDRHDGPVRAADDELAHATDAARMHDHHLNELRRSGVDVPRGDYIIGPILNSPTGDRTRGGVVWKGRDDG